jgi:hypothetical protein
MLSWHFGQKLGPPDCPYLIRWVFDFYFFSIRLHHWLKSDDSRHFHDHEWNFWAIIIKGSYVDVSTEGRDIVKFGSIRYRKAEHQHYVEIGPKGCWSLLLTGKRKRIWGFWVNGRFRKRNKYFFIFGHHNPCDK